MPGFACLAFALFFAWLFAVSAAHKLRHPQFYQQLLLSWFAPGAGSLPGSALALRSLAVLELVIALALLAPATRSLALLPVAALLLAYAAGMGWQLARGRSDLRCGCAGPTADTTISLSLVWRNLLCALLALLAAFPSTAADLPLAGGANALLVAVFLCVLYLCCEQLLSNAQRFALEKR